MDAELKQQQALMRSLREFVDTLRDIKQAKSTADMNSSIVEAVRELCGSSETENGGQWHDKAWRRGLVPTFQRLCLCMTRLDQLEAQESKQMGPLTPRQAENPKAPAGLLSLRDYSVLQAAVELLFCWGAYPRATAGVLMPIEKRRPTRTLEISKDILLWGYRGYTRVVADAELRNEETTTELLEVTQALLQLLSLPQFQPILLPKYVVELLALLVYGEVAINTEAPTSVQKEFIRLREMVLRVLPLRMSMSSLRAALGQTAPAVNEEAVGQRFKERCGHLLSQLLMEDGGIVATIEMLLGAVEEGNTQARMQVATLICQCPSGEDPEKYATALCAQVRELLLAAVTPEKGNTSSKLLGEMAALLTDQVATRHPVLFDAQILSVLFRPLLIYDDSRSDASTSEGDTHEEALSRCVGIARLLLCGPPPSQRFLQALAPLVRPLLHMYAFAATSKSFLADPLRALLTAWIRSCSNAPLLLQVAVLPVTLPLRPTLLVCGYERNYTQESWRPRREFCAGGGGGVSLRLVKSYTSVVGEERDTTESLKALIMPLVELLSDKELENSEVVGDLFSSLLLTYMRVRKLGATEAIDLNVNDETTLSPFASYEPLKTPTSAEGIEMVLMLLLALIECLGPSVLRSAATVLQCIGTVLETYNTPATKLVDMEQQGGSAVQMTSDDGEEGDEILTICLGVVVTILEAGSSHRTDAEEQQLCAMLPVLEVLSGHPRPEVAEFASNARAQILSRGVTEETDVKTTGASEQSFEKVFRKAEQDLSSQLVPLRARGVVTLTRLVRRSLSHAHEAEWTPRVHSLAQVFLLHLHDSESYVFLAAVQGLAALADAHPAAAIPALVKALQNPQNSMESRIKLSEALLFSAKRCGETLPQYGKLFVYAYLDCIRPPPSQKKRVERIHKEVTKRVQLIQEIQDDEEQATALDESQDEPENEQELLAAATLRASCLSNLAEVCALLQWGLQPFLRDVLTCVFGVLQLELELDAKRCPKPGSNDTTGGNEQHKLLKHHEKEQQQRVVAVRRGAVFVLRYLIELLGWKILELMPDQLSPLFRTLKHVGRVDQDRVVIFHTNRALRALNEVMRAELFPRVEQQDAVYGISRLRIV
ncbi:Required for nuclear transport of RNA pol II C-terminus 1 [Phytophthora infestans]|uniref:Required for nuclear transport of RNA pol II C-terminus 1 n=1 Tax=Phytophthora infestans TaxID=4787 RepID=A0A833RRC5_PHYIN|nr:Required for nuclear transport of RNA pol II C-terminus 1 [Phytophthora infestans]KAF4148115.1 Required for nuclear transport of RNA pol II C-terminus 1 [Phytophthora infestans]